MHLLVQVHVQSDPAGRLIVTGEPEQLDNPSLGCYTIQEGVLTVNHLNCILMVFCFVFLH